MSLFAKKIKSAKKSFGLEGLLSGLANQMAAIPVDKKLAKAAIGMESMESAQADRLSSAVGELRNILSNISFETMGGQLEENFTEAQIEAAQAAGVMGGDPESSMSQQAVVVPTSGDNSEVVGFESIMDGMSRRSFGREAYDESANRNAAVYSMAYNLKAARQDEFGETLFPTVTVTPDNVGFAVSIRLVQVYDDFKRNISGALDNYNMVNIVRGFANPNVLKNEMTRAVPVVRTESASNFVAAGDVPPAAILLDGESIVTAPLKFNNSFSLIAISQTDALLSNGAMDTTDSIDPGGLRLRNVFAKIGDNVVRFQTKDLPLSTFQAAPQGLQRSMSLSFTTEAILMNDKTTRYDGTALTGPLLAGLVTQNHIVRVSLTVSGNVNVQTGETSLMASNLRVVHVQDADGIVLDHKTAGDAKTLADAIQAGANIGYDLIAYRANANRRQRGQLLDVSYFNQVYTVPFRSPISAMKPVNSDSSEEAGDLAALISATQIRTSNAAVTQLLDTASVLNAFVDSRETSHGPSILGAARYLVKATYFGESVNAATDIDSITSTDRARDLQALLVNKIRDLAFRMWRNSEYQAMASVMKGGAEHTPTVIIATDPVLARYIQIDGDLRTAGASFNVRVVSTLDERMRGRIAVTFGDFTNVNEPNPLHFGNMAWKPELTLNLPISRNGQISKELTVQPAFLHITNLPILSFIEVSNVSDVMASKVPLYTEIQ